MGTNPSLDDFYQTALTLTKEAGELVRERFTQKKTVEQKDNDIDLVTETDKDVENLLIKGLKCKFPDHKFIGEESTAAGIKQTLTNDPTWIIDPIDGTMNFVHSFPHSCICVGLFIDRCPKIGIVYNPMLEQFFTACEHKGAYLNGKKITVSNCKELIKALVMLECGTSRDPERINSYKANHNNLIEKVHGVRSLGTAGLNMSMVATGGADAYFEFGVHAWDYAATAMIVREAGGVVMDPSGGPLDIMSRRVLAASTQELANALVKEIIQYYPKPRDDE